MKVIDYEKTRGYFQIQYLDDNKPIVGSINVDNTSMKLEAIVTKLIINNCENDIVTIDEKDLQFKIIAKDIEIIYKDVIEYDFFESFNLYNEREAGIKSKYVNVSERGSYNGDNILFQFYYKNAEVNEKGTASYVLKNIFEKSPRISDENSPKGYFNEFDILCRTFKTNFLAKYEIDIEGKAICCIPQKNKHGININKLIIEEVTKRDVRSDMSDIFEVEDYNSIKDKTVILISGIISDEQEIIRYRNKLIDAGAKSVIMYAFAKASVKL
ncbi:MAG: hypothetical protein PHR25_06165 [Clostridia bacterium]|nr:hypothetical protein [Clostridia bacterium]